MKQHIYLFVAVYTLTFVIVSALTINITLVDVSLALISTTVSTLVYVIRGYTQRYDIFTWFLALALGLLTVFVLRLFYVIAILHINGVI